MIEQSLSRGKALFTAGEACTRMYFVAGGHLDYFQSLDSVPTLTLRRQEYFCEMGLWLRWEYQGRIVATEESEIVGLDSQEFRTVANRILSLTSLKNYAQTYAESIERKWNDQDFSDVFWGEQDMANAAFDDQFA